MEPIKFDVEGVGPVIMVGKGPWHLTKVSSTYEVRDSEGCPANPTVIQAIGGTGRKANRNVIFAKKATSEAIVAKANELLAAA